MLVDWLVTPFYLLLLVQVLMTKISWNSKSKYEQECCVKCCLKKRKLFHPDGTAEEEVSKDWGKQKLRATDTSMP